MFKVGDLVHINKKLPDMMSHFPRDKDAIVIERNGADYGLFIKDVGEVSWYTDSNLKLIKSNQKPLLKEWKRLEKEEIAQKSDLDWIFSHGKEVLKHPHGATIQALAKNLGCKNLWGSRGEGITYYENSMIVFHTAKPFIEKGDKAGWIKFSKKFRKGAANEENKG